MSRLFDRPRMRLVALAGLVAAATACGSDSTAPKFSIIQFIAGDSLSDTVSARPVQALVVEVHGDPTMSPSGIVVRFQSVPYDSAGSTEPSMFIAPLTGNLFQTFVPTSTDSSGRAAVLLQMGRRTGTGRVAVAVPELGVEDTATFTILPGAAARVSMMPADTAMYVNGSVQLRAAVTDRYGNPRPDPVTYAAGSSGLSVTSSGAVSASTMGRYFLTVQAQGMVDTGWVSVVPQGTVAAYRYTDSTGIVMFNLDGSGYTWLAHAQDPSYDVAPFWFPSGQQVIFGSGSYSSPRLYTVDVTGKVAPFIQPAGSAGLVAESWPAVSHDGAWVYFSGQTSGTSYKLWRAQSDGSNAGPLGGLSGFGVAWRPTLSPDGTRVVFVSDGGAIRVLDLAPDTLESWSVSGQTPRWSPTGDQIAFTHIYGGPISVINADGTSVRTITQPNVTYAEDTFSWSPDGQWIIARESRGLLDVVNVQSGLTLPLGFTAKFTQPAWRP